MKKLSVSVFFLLAAAVLAAPVRITGFEDSDGRRKTAHGASGNALFSRTAGEELPEGRYALELKFGGRKDVAPRMRHWGNVSIYLPAALIPAGAKVIRFWVKGTPAKGYGIVIRLGRFIHMAGQNDRKAWIDFADGEWFQYECALKNFIPENPKVKQKSLTSLKGINYLTFSAVGDWRIKGSDRKEQKLYIDLIEVE